MTYDIQKLMPVIKKGSKEWTAFGLDSLARSDVPAGVVPLLFDPEVVYPATIARIREVLKGSPTATIHELVNPDDLIMSAETMKTTHGRIRSLPERAWDDALKSVEDVVADIGLEGMNAAVAIKFSSDLANAMGGMVDIDPSITARLENRAKALEAARLWATRAAKIEHKLIFIKITNAPRFRL